MHAFLRLLLLAIFPSSAVAAPSAAIATPHEAIALGPWTVQWDSARLIATAYGQQTFSLSEHSEGPDEYGYASQESFEVRSIVGPWLSVDHSWYSEGGAHPSYGITRSTYDLTRGGQAIPLNEMFPESALFDALRADTVIQKYLMEPSVQTFPELVENLYGGCAVSFSDILTAWAFHHVRGDQVAVRIGLGHGCEVARGSFTEIGIYLPIPEHLLSTIAAAEAEGGLMRNLSPR